ncbi:MAG: citrate/2-methylcitrate synthase [Candidatus Gygaella obscura]|nr:citrate/2-methylcitrate synthase [Candidatus Gygaella obscura]
MHENTKEITKLILQAKKQAYGGKGIVPEPSFTKPLKWPVECLVGPGLEGAIACESEVGYVNGSQGWLIYRGYDIFDLCAYSTYEEVCYLLLFGLLPSAKQLRDFKKDLINLRPIPGTIDLLKRFPIKDTNAMATLRIGINFLRRESTYLDSPEYKPDDTPAISADEDSIPMETIPKGEKHAIYEFDQDKKIKKPDNVNKNLSPSGYDSCYRLISSIATVAAAGERLRTSQVVINPDPKLSHAANLIYMITGKRPTPVEERIMDIVLILHADHGINASTFASLVVASTLSDIYFAIGSGVAALNGPLHGGANEKVLNMLFEIKSPNNVKEWFKKARREKRKIMGFGHRVYKAYDPRARILGPLAEFLVNSSGNKENKKIFKIAKLLEKEVVLSLGKDKKIFPNVDFYSGIVYSCLGFSPEMFTPLFAVSRVAGWVSRIAEYLEHNRIFRPRTIYTGPLNKKYTPMDKRTKKDK